MKYKGFILDDAKTTTVWRPDADERVNDMRSFGSNIFRICVFPDKTGCDYTISDNTATICDQLADQAQRYGMTCVFAVFLPGSEAGSKDGAMWASASLQASFGAMWKKFAQRYASKPWVWFDLLNEPVYSGDAVPERESP